MQQTNRSTESFSSPFPSSADEASSSSSPPSRQHKHSGACGGGVAKKSSRRLKLPRRYCAVHRLLSVSNQTIAFEKTLWGKMTHPSICYGYRGQEKLAHNASERQRKHHFNAKLMELGALLPTQSRKNSKISIVERAVDYLTQVRQEREELRYRFFLLQQQMSLLPTVQGLPPASTPASSCASPLNPQPAALVHASVHPPIGAFVDNLAYYPYGAAQQSVATPAATRPMMTIESSQHVHMPSAQDIPSAAANTAASHNNNNNMNGFTVKVPTPVLPPLRVALAQHHQLDYTPRQETSSTSHCGPFSSTYSNISRTTDKYECSHPGSSSQISQNNNTNHNGSHGLRHQEAPFSSSDSALDRLPSEQRLMHLASSLHPHATDFTYTAHGH
ncbi:hypothetical protein QOT17_013529 [Balamuthia mandrillaris]